MQLTANFIRKLFNNPPGTSFTDPGCVQVHRVAKLCSRLPRIVTWSRSILKVTDVRSLEQQDPSHGDRFRCVLVLFHIPWLQAYLPVIHKYTNSSFVISDGQHSMQAMLATQLNSLVHTKQVQVNSVIRINQYITNHVGPRWYGKIAKVEVVSRCLLDFALPFQHRDST